MRAKSFTVLVILSLTLLMVFPGSPFNFNNILPPAHADTQTGSLAGNGQAGIINTYAGTSKTITGSSTTNTLSRAGTCFTAASSGPIGTVTLDVGRSGTPTGTLVAEVYSTTGTTAGSPPASGTGCASLSTLVATSTTSLDISTLNSGTAILVVFDFNSGTVTSGTNYVVAIFVTFTQATSQSVIYGVNEGTVNTSGKAYVDNFGTNPRGALAQNANDADQTPCGVTHTCLDMWLGTGIRFSGSSGASNTVGRVGTCFTATSTGNLADLDVAMSFDGGFTTSSQIDTWTAEVYSTTGTLLGSPPSSGTGCASLSTLVATSTFGTGCTSCTYPNRDNAHMQSQMLPYSFIFTSGSVTSGNKYIVVIRMNYGQSGYYVLATNDAANTAMAYVDNKGTATQGALAQNANDADQKPCAIGTCLAFTLWVKPTSWVVEKTLTPDTLLGSVSNYHQNIGGAGNYFAGTCFTAGTTGSLQEIDFYASRLSPATGTITGQIYTTTGAIANGPSAGTGCAGLSSLLQTSTNSIDITTIPLNQVQGEPGGTGVLRFTFSGTTLASGSKYMAVLKFAATSASGSIYYGATITSDAAQAHVDSCASGCPGPVFTSTDDVEEYTCGSTNCDAFLVNVIPPPAYTYTVSNNGPRTIQAGQTGSVTITATQTSAGSAIAFIGGHSHDRGTLGISDTQSYTSSSGKTIIVSIAYGILSTCTSTTTVSSVTDSGGDTFTQLATVLNSQSGDASRESIWATGAGLSTASTTFTVTTSAACEQTWSVAEYSNVVLVGAVATKTATASLYTVSYTLTDTNNWLVSGIESNAQASASCTTGNCRQLINSASVEAVVDNTANSLASVTTAITATGGPFDYAIVAVELTNSIHSMTFSCGSFSGFTGGNPTCNSFTPSTITMTGQSQGVSTTLLIGVGNICASGCTGTFVVTGSEPTAASTTVTVIVPAYDFSLSNTGATVSRSSLTGTTAGSTTVTATIITGFGQSETFSCTSIDSQITGCTPSGTCTTTCSITVSFSVSNTARGTFHFSVHAAPAGVTTVDTQVNVLLQNAPCFNDAGGNACVYTSCDKGTCGTDTGSLVGSLLMLFVVLLGIYVLHEKVGNAGGGPKEKEYGGVSERD